MPRPRPRETLAISSYTFNFGDGTIVGPQTSPTANHTYQTPGTYYPVTVTVTDNNNATATATQTVTVNSAKYVNQIATNSSTSSRTSDSMAVWRTGGVAAGDLMVVTVQLTGTSAGAVAATDSKGDTFAVASDISDSSGDRLVTLSAVAANGLAVNDQITVTFPTASTQQGHG